MLLVQSKLMRFAWIPSHDMALDIFVVREFPIRYILNHIFKERFSHFSFVSIVGEFSIRTMPKYPKRMVWDGLITIMMMANQYILLRCNLVGDI